MSFRVSSSFKSCETIRVTTLFMLFQLCVSKYLKQPENCPLITPCFKLSVVPLLIDFKSETKKVLEAVKRLRVWLIVDEQDYTFTQLLRQYSLI